MPIKTQKSLDELVNLLESRKLKMDKAKVRSTLSQINYFQLINGFETLLLPDKKNKHFSSESFDDFYRLYKFDIEFSETVFSIISHFEMHLKTSVTVHFTAAYCSNLNDTMQYTNKHNYRDISQDNTYMFRKWQNKKICTDFNTFTFFNTRKRTDSRSNYLNELIWKQHTIDSTFYHNSNYTAPSNVAVYDPGAAILPVAVPLWVSIQHIDFGALKRLCHYLKPSEIEPVLHEFGLTLDDRNIFLNMLDIINELRNGCAHLSLINRFRTPSTLKINKQLVSKFSLHPKKRGSQICPASELKLFDSLKILQYFEDLDRLKKPLQRIIYKNNRYFKKRTYDLNSRLLTRMGEESLKEWKILFKKSQKKYR